MILNCVSEKDQKWTNSQLRMLIQEMAGRADISIRDRAYSTLSSYSYTPSPRAEPRYLDNYFNHTAPADSCLCYQHSRARTGRRIPDGARVMQGVAHPSEQNAIPL